MGSKSATILLVEDDETHAMLIMRCFEKMEGNKVHWVTNGEDALSYLLHEGKFGNKNKYPRPDLILLDLRLPKRDGHEVLKEIKTSNKLKTIPVVILTTSSNKQDLINAYMNHANGYLVKPLGFDKFQDMIEDLGTYWLKWNIGCTFETE
jgi:CheY-like chemotaxis protein